MMKLINICAYYKNPELHFTYLFLCRVSVPEYALPCNLLYWKGDPLMRGKVIKRRIIESPQRSRFMFILF